MTLPPAENLILKALAYEARRAAADRIARSTGSILRRLDRLKAEMNRADLP